MISQMLRALGLFLWYYFNMPGQEVTTEDADMDENCKEENRLLDDEDKDRLVGADDPEVDEDSLDPQVQVWVIMNIALNIFFL